MARLRSIIQNSDTLAGRVFDFSILALIVFSIVTLTVETLPGLASETLNFLRASEIIVTLLFTAEYIARIVTTENRRKYVLSFYGIIDLLAILPFYFALGLDLRGIRAFRLFRLFRLLKLPRYSRAMTRFAKALTLAKEELAIFLGATLLLLYVAAVGIYYFEHDVQPETFASIPHSLWWGVATLTTVGYGDIYPITVGGKVFTFVTLLIGIGVVAVPAGIVSASLAEIRVQDAKLDD